MNSLWRNKAVESRIQNPEFRRKTTQAKDMIPGIRKRPGPHRLVKKEKMTCPSLLRSESWFYSWILNSGFSVFIRHTLLLCATLFAQDLRADGGVARLKQSQGPITVTVFTPPAIYANAPTDVSILVQRSDSAELLLDAAVTLRIIPAKGVVIPA